MSKSRGNVVTPEDVLKEHSADAVRYWAASGRLGTDAAYDTGQIKVGRRLAIKVLNASKFALSFGDVDVDGDLAALVTAAARPRRCSPGCATSSPGPPPASRRGTSPARSRSPSSGSGRSATTTSSWSRTAPTAPRGMPSPPVPVRRCGSRSTSCCGCSPRSSRTSPRRSGRGPTTARCTGPPGRPSTRCPPAVTPRCSRAVGAALAAVRKAKSEAKVGMRAEVPSMTLVGPDAALAHVRAAEADLRAAGKLTGILELRGRRRGRRPRRRARAGAKPTA